MYCWKKKWTHTRIVFQLFGFVFVRNIYFSETHLVSLVFRTTRVSGPPENIENRQDRFEKPRRPAVVPEPVSKDCGRDYSVWVTIVFLIIWENGNIFLWLYRTWRRDVDRRERARQPEIDFGAVAGRAGTRRGNRKRHVEGGQILK